MDTLNRKKNTVIFVPLIIALVLGIFIAAAFGAADLDFQTVGGVLLSKIFPFLGLETDPTAELIVLQIRLPRILLSILVGMGLAVSGCVFQGVLKNPLADPFVLGVSAGAGLGITISVVSGFAFFLPGVLTLSGSAFFGAIVASAIVLFLSSRIKDSTSTPLILAGIAIEFLFRSCISLIMYFNRDQVEKIIFWTLGSFAASSWDKVGTSALFILAGTGVLLFYYKELNILSLGDDTARGLGIEVRNSRVVLLILATLVTASAVSVSGIVGFVGLVIPHISRLILGPDHRVLIPTSMLIGGIFLLFSDTLARTLLAPSELPVGIITSLIGAPYFLFLLFRKKKGIQ